MLLCRFSCASFNWRKKKKKHPWMGISLLLRLDVGGVGGANACGAVVCIKHAPK